MKINVASNLNQDKICLFKPRQYRYRYLYQKISLASCILYTGTGSLVLEYFANAATVDFRLYHKTLMFAKLPKCLLGLARPMPRGLIISFDAAKVAAMGPWLVGTTHPVHLPVPEQRLCSTADTAVLSMDLLKDLRSRTGAPIVDCKKALIQVGGNDIQKAMDWLREHGAAKTASKVAGRVCEEGLVGLQIATTSKHAVLIKIAAETDFAGRSATFVQLVSDVAGALLHSPALPIAGATPSTVETEKDATSSIMNATTADGTKTVQALLDDAIVSIRENISVSNVIALEGSQATSVWVGYVHNRVNHSIDAGTAAAVVELAPLENMNISHETMLSAGKKLAMHIVASRPSYRTVLDIPENVLEKERTILTNQLGDAHGKPAEIVEKIVQGKLRKFYESVCLTEQAHVIEEGNPKIATHLANLGITLLRYEAMSIS